MWRAVAPRESRAVFRRSVWEIWDGDERMEWRRSVLLRRHASRTNSRGEAPCGSGVSEWSRIEDRENGDLRKGTYFVVRSGHDGFVRIVSCCGGVTILLGDSEATPGTRNYGNRFEESKEITKIGEVCLTVIFDPADDVSSSQCWLQG